MKLYDTRTAPNPRRVRVFLAEKGIEIPQVQQIDLGKLEQKGEEFTRINPVQRTPALELDDGTVLTESVATCRFFEELHPEPPLMGSDAKSKAVVEMWQRRLELHLLMPVAMAFRHIHPAMAQMENPQFPEFGKPTSRARSISCSSLIASSADGATLPAKTSRSPTLPVLLPATS